MFKRDTWVINYPLLIGTFIVGLVCCLVVVGIHGSRKAAAIAKLEKKAEHYFEEGNYKDAYGLIENLVKVKPEEPLWKLKAARCADETAESSVEIQKAIKLNTSAIIACQSSLDLSQNIPDLRYRLVKRFSQIGSFEEAIDQILRLVGPDGDLQLQAYYTIAKTRLWLDGRGMDVGTGNNQNLPSWFAELVQMRPVDLLLKTHVDAPQDFEIANLLVDLCLGDPAKLSGSILSQESKDALVSRAQGVVERLVAKRPEDPFAWMLRYEIVSRDYKLTGAEEDIEKAIRLNPDDSKVLTVAGKLYMERAKRSVGLSNKERRDELLDRSLKLFQQAKSKNSKEAYNYLYLGEIYEMRGMPESAVSVWRDAKRICKDRLSLLEFRIVNSLITQQQLPEAFEALQSMDNTITLESSLVKRSEGFANLREGRKCWSRYYLAMGDIQNAIQSLASVLSNGNELDALNQAAIYETLGDCYTQIGQFDRSASSFEQALLTAPGRSEYRRKAALAWLSANRTVDAYRQYLLVEPKDISDWVRICDIILQLQREGKTDPNYWFMFNKGISEVKRLTTLSQEEFRNTWYLEILQLDANVLSASDKNDSKTIQTASEQLWDLVKSQEFSSECMRAAIIRWKAWNQTEYLNKLSDEVLESDSSSNLDAVRKADLLVLLGKNYQAQEVLETKLRSDPDNVQVQQAISRLEMSRLPLEEAIEKVKELKQQGWFSARQLAWNMLRKPLEFSEAEQMDEKLRNEKLSQWLTELKNLEELLRDYEGSDGTEWRYIKGKRLLADPSNPDRFKSIELLELAGYLDLKRPLWPESHLLAAQIAEGQGNRPRAIREYSLAIQCGNNDLSTYERLLILQYQSGLITDARSIIDRLGNRAFLSQSISSISIQLAGDSSSEQLSTAERATKIRPNDPMSWVWLAQITELNSRASSKEAREVAILEAERCFEKAASLSNPKDPTVFLARFNFYQSLKSLAGQEAVLKQFKDNGSIEPGVHAIATGQMLESLGEVDQSIASYRKAISLGMNDLDLLNRITQLLIDGNRLEDAIAVLKETLERHPDDAATRRRLALLLATRSFDEDWEQVAELLSPNKLSNTPDDVRLQIVLLGQKNDLSRLQKSQELLERLVELPGVRTNEDQFQLACVYLRNARLLETTKGRELEAFTAKEAAGRMLKIVASGSSPKPEYLYAYADYLIRQNRLFDAIEESQKLVSIAPESYLATLLSSRLTKLDGDHVSAKRKVLAWLEGKRQEFDGAKNAPNLATALIQAGQALQILEESQESQKLFKEAYLLDKRAGAKYVRSILMVDDPSIRDNAIKFLMDRLQTDKAKESALLLSLLIRKGDTDEQLTRSAEKRLVEYTVAQKDDRALLQSMADLSIWRGNESQAIETFRRIIRDRPNDVVALNNLAMLLADTPQTTQESMQYVEQAIRLIGAKPALLDSKAYVLLRMGKHNEAIAILKSLQLKEDSPSVRFHLYQAYRKANLEEQAKEILSTINFESLKKSPLTQADREELQRVEQSNAV